MIALTFSRAASADYYKYTDSRGVVCISNSIESVPQKYRSSMKVIKEDAVGSKRREPWKEGEASPQAEPAEETGPEAQTGLFGTLAARYGWFKPLAIICGLIVSFLAVVKISSMVSSPQLARIIYLAYFLGISTYGYTVYSKALVDSYFSIKQKTVAMFTKANNREGLNQTKENPDPMTGMKPAEK